MTPLSNAEIDELETALDHRLPGLYRKLLVEVGFGTRGDLRIYHPSEIAQIYQYHFEDSADLFARWFPFGCDERRQEIWLIDPVTETAASIWHETHPDDYEDEDWLSYEDWIVRNLPDDRGSEGGEP